ERATRAAQARTLEEKRIAEDARAAAQQVNEFLVNMLQSVDPAESKGKPVLVRDVLDKSSTGVAGKFPGQPSVEAAVRLTLARTYHALGLYAQAEPHMTAALALYRQIGGDDSPQAIEAESQ